MNKIPIAKPSIGDEEKQAVMAVLDSGMLVQGKLVEEFEQKFAAYHGARYGVAASNGTTALTMVMMAHGIGPGDEVIIPSFTFFATASCVLSVGATPVFADIDPDTYCLSPEAAEAAITPRTVAIMPVHLYGYPADMPRFEAICAKHNLILLEDAAQAHGASIGERKVGTWGEAAFSFYATKNMTTGEGGMVLTNNADIDRKLRMLRNQGMNQQYCHEVVGYNFRMTNIEGAIGLAQLTHLTQWNIERRATAAFYNQNLKGVKTPTTTPDYTHVYHQYTLRAPEGVNRDQLAEQLNALGIGTRVYYPIPTHRQPAIMALPNYKQVDLPHTEKAVQEVFSLPVHPALTQEEREYIVEKVNSLC